VFLDPWTPKEVEGPSIIGCLNLVRIGVMNRRDTLASLRTLGVDEVDDLAFTIAMEGVGQKSFFPEEEPEGKDETNIEGDEMWRHFLARMERIDRFWDLDEDEMGDESGRRYYSLPTRCGRTFSNDGGVNITR
jgi:hypothetical protein